MLVYKNISSIFFSSCEWQQLKFVKNECCSRFRTKTEEYECSCFCFKKEKFLRVYSLKLFLNINIIYITRV